jgi:hypothetical protein
VVKKQVGSNVYKYGFDNEPSGELGGIEYEKKQLRYKETGNNHMLAARYLALAIYYFNNVKDATEAALYFLKSYALPGPP